MTECPKQVDGFRIDASKGRSGLTFVESPDMLGLVVVLSDGEDVTQKVSVAISDMKDAGWTPEMERKTRSIQSYWGA